MIKSKNILLLIILGLALFLRVYKINTLPIALSGDEIDAGYQAWSLATTARDYTGHLLPTFLHSLSEMRTPLLPYFLSPFIGIFGPSVESLKIPVALLGVFNVFLVYFLVNKLFLKQKYLGLLSALILATSPWHIHFSRIAFDSTLLLSLYLGGVSLFVSGLAPLSLIPFILTFWTYPTANIFTPLLMALLFIVYKPHFTIKKNIILFVISLLLIIPVAINFIGGASSGRFSGISIFSDQKLVDAVIVSRTEPWVFNSKLEPIFHNKPIIFLKTFTNQYLSAFSPDFLFISGDPNFRHSIGEFGELFVFLSPFFLIGLYSLFKSLDKSSSKILISWLILSPIASALTQGGGTHAIRLIIMLPALVIIIAVGVSAFWELIRHPKLRYIYSILFITTLSIFTIFYWHRYEKHYQYLSFRNWQYGYEQVLNSIPPINGSTKIFINNTYEPSLMKYLFYAKVPPKYFQKEFSGDVTIDNIYKDISGYKFGNNTYFVSPGSSFNMNELMDRGDYYVAAQGKEIPGDWDWNISAPKGFTVLSSTRDPYGSPLFYLLRKD